MQGQSEKHGPDLWVGIQVFFNHHQSFRVRGSHGLLLDNPLQQYTGSGLSQLSNLTKFQGGWRGLWDSRGSPFFQESRLGGESSGFFREVWGGVQDLPINQESLLHQAHLLGKRKSTWRQLLGLFRELENRVHSSMNCEIRASHLPFAYVWFSHLRKWWIRLGQDLKVSLYEPNSKLLSPGREEKVMKELVGFM